MPLDVSLPGLRALWGEEHGRRVLTAALVLLALVSALAWTLALRRQGSAPASPAVLAAPAQPPPALLGATELAQGLGASHAAATEATPAQRFVLQGVIARASGQGAALIAVDGAPPRPFGVGAELAPGFVLQRLAPREVMLGESATGPVKLRLPLPEWEPPSRAAAPPTGSEAPAESTSAQPGRRGDQGGP